MVFRAEFNRTVVEPHGMTGNIRIELKYSFAYRRVPGDLSRIFIREYHLYGGFRRYYSACKGSNFFSKCRVNDRRFVFFALYCREKNGNDEYCPDNPVRRTGWFHEKRDL